MAELSTLAPPTETHGGPLVFALRDVLSQLPLPAPFNTAAVSTKWRCVLAPTAEVGAGASPEGLLLSEEELMPYLEAGVPVRASKMRATAAHTACGPDSLRWLTDPRWTAFPKPQIALRRGWGAPGVDIHVSSFHKMISSFEEVFHHTHGVEVPLTQQELEAVGAATAPVLSDVSEAEEVLDLQLFHRSDGCPPIPILGEHLLWPSFVADGAVCDQATWVSQRGMVRHWHLNDCGEFAMQAALPLPVDSRDDRDAKVSLSDPKLRSPPSASPSSGSSSTSAMRIRSLLYPESSAAGAAAVSSAVRGAHVPAMLTIFAPKGGYDWVLHDDEANMCGKVVSLDLFQTPDEALPCDAALLPVLTVAVLESGGAPLIIPPNLTQTSIALRDCVVVEQRRISNLWLDDVSYFLHRCARWQASPIIYAYLQQNLQDDSFVAGQVVPYLIRVFEEHGEATPYHAAIRRRAVLSLHALARNQEHYGLSDSSRASLERLLHGGNPEMHAVLQSAPYCASSGAEAPATMEEWLAVYWGMSWCWPKPGCVLRVPNTVHPLSARLTPLQQKAQYIPVVYPPMTCSPVYGTEKDSVEATVQQYFEMKELESKPRELMAYLRTRKMATDDILDYFF
ncbi:conserved hypothetical protein [Leishmania mexicana MHOM/GT/2001/U1103]|uniref:Uncharacterized protein n=1 Tax=Leishmania mexicana (strain MHOM/GT/2001/U1103) TaxID=929439 RepID=E9B2V5_LEIMU|nr:conserved hypothetical protein [Leishmania mexicana MHOM/GT/2001/U1103]CBZ29569.1 conserved hypothetical protein [Leishmania mexicana MHOM/GT/2001/U1103]